MSAGRTRELAELSVLLENAREGQSSSLVIHGDAGNGAVPRLGFDAIRVERLGARPWARVPRRPAATT